MRKPVATLSELLEIFSTRSRLLKAKERQQLLVHWDEQLAQGQPRPSRAELAEQFGVARKQIDTDYRNILSRFAAAISPEKAMEYVGRVLLIHERLVREALGGLEISLPGSLSHQAYLKIASDLAERELKTLQSVGIVREELGRMTVTEERWVATIDEFGTVSSSVDDGTRCSTPPPTVPGGETTGDDAHG